jgi:hypothetical protein
MTTRILRIAVAILAASLSARAGAHDFQCTATFGLASADSNGSVLLGADGLPVVAAGAATTFVLDTYPAFVAFQVDLRNTVPETSVVTGAENSAAAALGGTVYGPEIAAGFSLPPDGAADQTTILSIPSYEACLALGGVPGAEGGDGTSAPACWPGSFDARFAVTHDLGSAECRARLVCNPPREPTACTTPSWTGAIDVPNMIRGVVDSQGRVVLAGTEIFPVAPPAHEVKIVSPGGDLSLLAAWGGAAGDTTDFVREGATGELFVAGRTSVGETGRGYVRKLAPDGSLEWETLFHVDGTIEVTAVDGLSVDAAGDSYVLAQASTAAPDVAVVELSPTGAVLWSRRIATAGLPVSVAATGSGVFVSGWGDMALVDGGLAPDYFVARLDGDGNVVWVKRVGPQDAEVVSAVVADPAGGVIAVGYPTSPVSPGSLFVAHLDASGSILWQEEIALSPLQGEVSVNDAALDASGNIWVTGPAERPDLQAIVPFVAKLDADGQPLWTTQIVDPVPAASPNSISVDCSGNGYVVGQSYAAGAVESWLRRISSDGSL